MSKAKTETTIPAEAVKTSKRKIDPTKPTPVLWKNLTKYTAKADWKEVYDTTRYISQMSDDQLAWRLDVSKDVILSWKNGKAEPPADVIRKLMIIFAHHAFMTRRSLFR